MNEKEAYLNEICELIRIPSRSSPKGGEEGRLQAVVAERMRNAGARVRSFGTEETPEFFRHRLCCGRDRCYRDRPTVIGELGPEHAPALLVLAHSDTVQITRPADWTFDPYCGELRDGRICGLGAEDDKWGTAVMLTMMRALTESRQPLSKRLIFASTIDEENGVGNGTLLLMLAGIRAEGALYLDGNLMQICIGNLGGSFLYVRPKNPIGPEEMTRHAVRLKSACAEMSRERVAAFNHPKLRENIWRERSVILYEWEDENGPYFNVAFYTVPGDSRADICSWLETNVQTALGKDVENYALSYLEPWFEPALVSENTPMVRHLSNSIRSVLGREPIITTVCKIDAFVLSNHAGIPTVSFGPAKDGTEPGSFHQPDEYIAVEKAWAAYQIVRNAVHSWLED